MAFSNLNQSVRFIYADTTLATFTGWLKVVADVTGAAITLTLPKSVNAGILDIDLVGDGTYALAVAFVNSETCNGETSLSINVNGDHLRLVPDGTSFYHGNPSVVIP